MEESSSPGLSKDRNFALIKDGKVVNIIYANLEFVMKFDFQGDIVDLTFVKEAPSIGSDYNRINQTFHTPQQIIDEPVNKDQDHLRSGTCKTFKKFIIENESEKFIVKMVGKYVDIGCMRYDALWLRDAFYKILRENKEKVGVLGMNLDGNLSHGAFQISKENMEQVLTALETIQF